MEVERGCMRGYYIYNYYTKGVGGGGTLVPANVVELLPRNQSPKKKRNEKTKKNETKKPKKTKRKNPIKKFSQKKFREKNKEATVLTISTQWYNNQKLKGQGDIIGLWKIM